MSMSIRFVPHSTVVASLRPEWDLDFDAQRASYSSSMVPLYDHQLAELYKMHRLERSQASPIQYSQSTSTTSRMGVLCSKPGSGKSATILALIASSSASSDASTVANIPPPPPMIVTTMNGMVSTSVSDMTTVSINTNVLVVPRSLLSQWKCYVDLYCDIPPGRTLIRASLKLVDLDAVFSGTKRLVITSERGARSIIDDSRYSTMTFSRFIIDEADSISVPCWNGMPRARFVWFVTASRDSLLMGCARTMFIREFFRQLYTSSLVAIDPIARFRAIFSCILVRSSDSFVEMSISMPPIVSTTIRIVRELYFGDSELPRSVLDALNADDTNRAIVLMGCNRVTDSDCLVAAVTQKMTETLHNLQSAMECASTTILPSLAHRHNVLAEQIRAVEQRIRDSGVCAITLEPIETRAVMPCCNNSFELKAVMRALEQRQICPMCRASISIKDIIVHVNATDDDDDCMIVDAPPVFRSKRAALVSNVRTILASSAIHRVLVFSCFDFDFVRDACRDADVEVVMLKGHTSIIARKVAEYKEGRNRVLFLDAQSYGAGLNLDCTTHIITYHCMNADQTMQIIGRAQRCGRSAPLNVINLRYAHESE
jgi:SNF2-related domain